jgi:hypothetical protein
VGDSFSLDVARGADFDKNTRFKGRGPSIEMMRGNNAKRIPAGAARSIEAMPGRPAVRRSA